MALRFREQGYASAFALDGGFDAWRKAGYPVEPLRAGDASANASAHQIL